MSCRVARIEDAAAVAEIYDHYVLTSHATFEVDPVPRDEMAARIANCLTNYLFFVFEEDEVILGYAYAHRYRERPAYGKTVEVSVYVSPAASKKGVATALYQVLLPELSSRGFHTAVAGISLPNDASTRRSSDLSRSHTSRGWAKVRALDRCRVLAAASRPFRLTRAAVSLLRILPS